MVGLVVRLTQRETRGRCCRVDAWHGGGRRAEIATAGGMDLPDHPLGTDASLIHRVISSVYSIDGVAVLVDLGSAIMSTELALEMLLPEQRANVVIVSCPARRGRYRRRCSSPPKAARLMRLLPKRACLWMRNSRRPEVTDDGDRTTDDASRRRLAVIASNEPSLELTLPVNILLGLHAVGGPICADCRVL